MSFWKGRISLTIAKQLGEKIKALRKETGLSQEKFALKIDMDRTYFATVESGKRNISLQNIEKIAKGLDISISELFEGIGGTAMTNTEIQIKSIVYEEFSKLVETIEGDFKTNFVKKRYNFLLSQLDETITANMVFVSSFESKSGFAIETCAKRIARLKFGEENVPAIVNPRNVKHNINPEIINGQIIVTDIDIDNGDLRGNISKFRATNVASGKGSARVESGITQSSIKTLLPMAQKYKADSYYTKPVDLAFFDGKDWVVLELKAGGDLDSSNAPANVEKLLTIYAGLNVSNSKAYFATLYNKNGEGNTWTGAVKKHMSFPEMFLIGKKFWNTILPDEIIYDRFTEIYKMALEELDLNFKIKEMIRKTVK